MSAIVARPAAGGALGRLLSAAAHATLERLPLPHRDLPPEWFRFPLP